MNEIALHILDIVQNSIRAGAWKIEVLISENKGKDIFELVIKDDGKGMDQEQLNEVMDPFFTTRTTRKVGLGIALLKQGVEQTGGHMEIESQKGKGTFLRANYLHNHVDRPILGDIAGTMTILIGANPKIRFIYTHQTPLSTFEFDTKEVLEELDGVPINDADILKALKELIEENLDMIEASVH
ncbi:MAG: ATP-binding protein [Prolixibacteraceae bacterium]